jgi:hypothetical protein
LVLENHSRFWATPRSLGLAAQLHPARFVKPSELDAGALLERIANALGDCLALGSLSRKTGALSAQLPRSERWATLLSHAESGAGSIFPGARLGALAALLNKISEGTDGAEHFDQASLVAEGSRLVFQRCPWNTGEVLFAVFPENGAAAANFERFRLVLESVRRDVAIVRAPRVEERCWN